MEVYQNSVIKHLGYYKSVADKTFAQVADEGLFWQYNSESNSIVMIVQHLAGNMFSRWTDFLTSDGEKAERNRDAEFGTMIKNREEMLGKWEAGWRCMLDTLASLKDDDWDKTVYIRGQAHSVVDAINRQVAHVPYHIGQIVLIGKMLAGDNWKSLSIPKGGSVGFNEGMRGRF
jgi:hypothetical protein